MNRKNPQRLTLKEVATALNVSTATVSNAFNRPSQLSRELRERILAECRDMGYAGPNAESRSLRTAKTKVIGVMLSNQLSYSFSDPVANQMLQGLSQIFEEPEYNLLVMPSRSPLTHLLGVESFVDGFIIYGPPAQDRLKELQFHKKAIVAIDFDMPGVTSINVDNRRGAKECATHAFQHQPKHPAILGLRLMDENTVCTLEGRELFDEFSNITVQRLLGFKEAATAAETYIPDSRIWHIPDNTKAYAFEAAIEALSATPRPDLLLCMSDRVGLSAIKAAQSLGLRVPQDVMITGFDGIEEAEITTPGLTTMDQPSMQKGRIAAEIFLGQRSEENIMLHARLKVRESCPDPN